MFNKIFHTIQDPLYKNSFYLMSSYFIAAGFGFIFWIIAAKLYLPEDIGIATGLIASIGFLNLISRMGFDHSVIRFFSETDKNKIFSTSLGISTLITVFFGLVFILGIDTFSPNLSIIREIPFLYLAILIATSIVMISGTTFVASRIAKYSLIQNIILGSRVVFLFPLIALGSFGIFTSYGFAYLIALVAAIILISHLGIKLQKIDTQFLKSSFTFSIHNYIAGLFIILPTQLLPIIVLNLEGPVQAAYFYIAFSISLLLFQIPTAFSTSLFVEGSHGQSLRNSVLKSFYGAFLILIPCVVLLFFFGENLLNYIGEDYIVGINLLRVMAVSSFFYTIFHIYSSIKKVQKETKILLIINGVNFCMLVGLSYIFLIFNGIIGVGYAWLLSYGISSVIIIISLNKVISFRAIKNF